MSIEPGKTGKAADFINESERDATPANDEGRVAKLESDGKLGRKFLRSFQIKEYALSGSPATWTKPDGLKYIRVQAWGGGGSGMSVTRTNSPNDLSASGGGGGGYADWTFQASELSATEAVTVGAGGLARVANNTSSGEYIAGAGGGDTTFGSLLTANGGGGARRSGPDGGGGGSPIGGAGGTEDPYVHPGESFHGGAGGGSGGDRDYTSGQPGAFSVFGGGGGGGIGNRSAKSGGSSKYGGRGGNAARSGNSGTPVNGGDGETPAGGGGAAAGYYAIVTSGKGGDGFVRITEYF